MRNLSLCMTLWAHCGLIVASAAGQPELVLSKTEWDFGAVWFGDKCETEIEIINYGDAPLLIQDVKTSCGCTAAKPSKSQLGPGESDKLKLSYNTRKGVKDVSQTVTIVTNDPTKPSAYIRVRGIVKHVYDPTPTDRALFGQIPRDARLTKVIDLSNNLSTKTELKLRPVSPTVPFDVKLEEVEAGMRYRLTVRTRPPLPPGPTSTKIILDTGVPKLPTMTFTISAIALAPIAVFPDKIMVVSASDKPFRRSIRLNSSPGEPVEITAVRSSDPSITTTISAKRSLPTATSAFSSVSVIVSLPAWQDLPDEGSWIEIETDAPAAEYRKFRVPIIKRPPPPTRK